MIFDWKNNKEEAMQNGICEKQIYSFSRIVMQSENGVISNHAFCNFEQLEFEEGVLIQDCIFENCGTITFDGCRINNCTFKNIDTIFATDTKFTNSCFREMVCHNDMIISLENGEISYCEFYDIELDDSYLIEGFGDAFVENSDFKKIRTTREDKELFIMEEKKGVIFKKTKRYSFVDEGSCKGLEEIIVLD